MSNVRRVIYEFGPFRIDLERYLLLRGDETVALPPKAFETLLFLVQNRGQVSKKNEILSAVWPGTFVEESNLAQNIFLLRKALGEGRNDHRYIVTIPGEGYRFVALVKESAARVSVQVSRNNAFESIAVLPFKNLSSSENEIPLGTGLADALIMRLSSIRHLIVRPTTAVLRYTQGDQNAASI